MTTQNLSTLKIHKLTKAQYERELAAGNIDANAIYLTPDEAVDLSGYVKSLSDLGITATAAELNRLDGVTTTTAELNHVAGVTSKIQDQLNGKVPTSRTVNGKALSANISLAAGDVGAYTKAEIDSYSLITVEDIDTICGTTIQVATASEVTF